MKLRRSVIIPCILAVYLAVMAWIGYPGMAEGRTSPLYYWGIIAITSVILVLLHINLRRREKYRDARRGDNRDKHKNKHKISQQYESTSHHP